MPENIGEMFYFGDILWHGQGTRLESPVNMEEAIAAGGLGWEVDTVGLMTAESPSSPARTRVAIVRKDRAKGHPERVVGVRHGLNRRWLRIIRKRINHYMG